MMFGQFFRSQSSVISRAISGTFAIMLMACLVPASLNAQNTISTVAGGGVVSGLASGGPGPNGGGHVYGKSTSMLERPTSGVKAHAKGFIASANYADLAGPNSVIRDSQGNTYVAVPNSQQVFKIDTANNVSLFAGLGWSTEQPTKLDGGPATLGSLNEPTGLAIDSAGNIYIADTTNYLIRKVDTKGVIHTIAGNTHLCGSPTSPCGDHNLAVSAQLSYPDAVAVDAAGNVYIADTVDNRLRVVNTGTVAIRIAGVVINPNDINTVAGNGTPCANPTSACGDGGQATAANLNSPQGVAVDSKGNIFIADSSDHRIRVVTTSGVISTYAGNGVPCNNPGLGCGDGGAATAANISTPWQISVDAAGDLYVSDPPENRIRLIAASTKKISSVAGNGAMGYNGNNQLATSAELNGPRGVWVDSSGNIVIGDTGNQQVRQVTASNGFITLWAGSGLGGDNGPATSAILAEDKDVALDSAGNLYIADTANNRIRKVTPGNPPGNITTVAGTGIAGNFGNNGSAVNASLSGPYGLAVDSSSNIYIADTFNLVVRLVNASTGIITTVAGNGQSCNPTTSCGDGGPATSASLAFPTNVAVDNAGNFYIADAGANKIRVVNSSGIISTLAGDGSVCDKPLINNCGDNGPAASAQLNAPMGVAVDSNGNVYIADTMDNRVRKVDPSGTITGYAFNGKNAFGPNRVAATSSSYNTPQYLAVDPHGNLYVSGSDFYYVIQRIDGYNGTVISVAGLQGDPKFYGFAGDGGAALSANLNNFGVAIDGSGHLFVADGGNNRVRYIPLVPTANTTAISLTFPTEPIGTTSAPMTLGLVDQGSDDMYITAPPTLTGDFQIAQVTGNTCSQNVIAPFDRCNYAITFTPTGYGLRSGSIVFNDNAYGRPQQKVFLTGNGPSFTMSANPASLTIPRNNQSTSVITLTPTAGFNQLVTLGCTAAPMHVVCSFSPSQITLNGTSSSTSTLTVKVGPSAPVGTSTVNVNGIGVAKATTPLSLTIQ